MTIYIPLALQPDNDWIINGQQTTVPATPYIADNSDTALQLTAFFLLGVHLRNLPPYQQNHLAGSVGVVTWDISGMTPYHSLL